ncbi:Putative ER membrane protein complex subunit 1 [Septoria linicola]|uniref:ER membrane protein complex subunit 1 n=1 Tax=Septoria linicola TaxID=215465 RepID=A0A9Q9AN97_9PEZI|nr:putative ER membrane protein complex subunit 1 [Septoria linicola]USW52612.1 Putative ER membrane protein complex subunit 1 [Septoria linicola]
MLLPLLAATTLLLRSTQAIFADEAWNVDYHHPLLGLPKEETTLFHRPNPASKASLIYALSEERVLGAVNPRDGSIVWRQLLAIHAGSSNSSFLRAGQGQDVVVSGVGHEVSAWSAADGRLAWNRHFDGLLEDLEIVELADSSVKPGVKDTIVLTSGEHSAIHRLDGSSGDLKWRHSIESGDVPYQLSASATDIFAILLHKTILGNVKIKVLTLDPVTGRKTDEYTLSSDSELASADTIVAVGANSASPIIAWTDAAYTVLKVNIIGTKSVASFAIDKHNDHTVNRVRLHAPYHTSAVAHFLVQFDTGVSHWADVYHIDLKRNKVEKAYSLPKVSGQGSISTSNLDANVYFTRVTTGEVVTVSSDSHGVLGRWTLSDLSVGAVAGEVVTPVHSISEVSTKGGDVSAVRSAILLSTGDWVLVRGGIPVWQRPEALASTISATFATTAEVEAFAHELEIEAHSNFISAYLHRVARHLQDLQRLPEVLSNLPQKLKNGVFGTTADTSVGGDVFGFHQIIACATKNGRVVALDAAAANKILWSKDVAQLKSGETWSPQIETAANGVLFITVGASPPLIALNASTGATVADPALVATDAPDGASITFSLQTNGDIAAFKPSVSAAQALWHFIPSQGEHVVSLVPRPVNDPVASIGKVLGDRRVLYKYLSPNIVLLVTVNKAAHSATFYILDTVTGSTLHANVQQDVDLQEPIAAIITENWYAYSYTAEAADDTPKGHHLVVGELFESFVPNDRGPLSERTNSSSLQQPPEPFVLSKSYQIPEAISKLAITRTRQGITTRQLLAVLADSASVVGIPYQVLDPRRPVGRDPTKDEQMEGLVRYIPTIEFDPKWHLNHKRDIIGIQDVVTSPALVESTSLVFAYGLDLFGTRLTPSSSFDVLGKDFNKFQMLATVAGLAIVTFVVAPLVTRKQVNQRWQFA